MPCYDPDRHDSPNTDLIQRVANLEQKLDEKTSQLCQVMALLEKRIEEVYVLLPHDLRKWHEEHKQFDNKRRLTESGSKE